MGISVQASGIKVEKNKFYLVNLNADPSLNELLVYYLKVTIVIKICFVVWCIFTQTHLSFMLQLPMYNLYCGMRYRIFTTTSLYNIILSYGIIVGTAQYMYAQCNWALIITFKFLMSLSSYFFLNIVYVIQSQYSYFVLFCEVTLFLLWKYVS